MNHGADAVTRGHSPSLLSLPPAAEITAQDKIKQPRCKDASKALQDNFALRLNQHLIPLMSNFLLW